LVFVTRSNPPRDLFDLLACPLCKTRLERRGEGLSCAACGRTYPIVDGVPVLFPDGHVPELQDQRDLVVRTTYHPWIERLVMQSLPNDAIVIDLGAGNRANNLPHVIRMDVIRTPYVDVVGDVHAMPFLPGSVDFIFSLAVIEHLRQPFVAAQQMADALRTGGYVYGECNFVFPYHGFPHHYFNASQHGLEQVFAPFTRLRSGVAPYQMPSFAVKSVLTEYSKALDRVAPEPTARLRDLIDGICSEPLGACDQYFPEGLAMTLAAGVFFFGVKAPDDASEVIPDAVQRAWRESPSLQQQFPTRLDLGHVPNLMLWAKSTGRTENAAIAACLDAARRFHKRDGMGDGDLRAFEAEPAVEPAYGHIGAPPRADKVESILNAVISLARRARDWRRFRK
jgi:uncharacterized protein YbaR (Trm112 family)/SAM-dependent methyltransferase